MAVSELNPQLRALYEPRKINYHIPGLFLISFPKSGRTWLRMIFARLLQLKGIDPAKNEFVYSAHWSHEKAVSYLSPPSNYKIIFLHRDPRDVLVSLFWEFKRSGKFTGNISDFLRTEKHGAQSLTYYVKTWKKKSHQWGNFYPVLYERLHDIPYLMIRWLCDSIGFKVDSWDIKKAIKYSSFENMRRMELGQSAGNLLLNYKGNFGQLAPPKNKEELRVRKGKVGGYVDYLSKEDIKYIEKFM